jgi:hypothetical protein
VAPSTLDKQIDELYQLSPGEFTAARNALAKTVASDDKVRVRALRKPSVPAWAVNQLYWRDRRTWDDLIKAAEQLRSAHRAALRGRASDLRQADAEHREALAKAIKQTMALAAEGGHPANAALKEAVMRTLQSLPADIEAGRLDAPLTPAGFGVLEGVTPAPTKLRIVEKKPAAPLPASRGKGAKADREAERRRAIEEKRAQAEAEKAEKRARIEAEREQRERERLAAKAAQRIAQLTATVERARKHENDLRDRLNAAEEQRRDAERELARAKRDSP